VHDDEGGPLAGTSGATLVLGVPVDDVTMGEAVDIVFQLARDGQRRSRTHQVATVNVDFVVNAHDDDVLMDILAATSLSIPDGMPVVWASRLMGTPLRARVSGADLVPAIVQRAAPEGATIVLYGAGPGIARRAAEVLRERTPRATVVGLDAPAFSDPAELDERDLAPLREARATVCCVAFGNPKQERFIAHWAPHLGIPVMIGVGGSLDFIAGAKRRAPQWMQRSGLEWLHRAITEPRRLARRYARDLVVFGPAVLRQAWRGRRGVRRGRLTTATTPDGGLVVDLSELVTADNRTAAAITSAVRTARRSGRPVELRGATARAVAPVTGLERVVALAAGSR